MSADLIARGLAARAAPALRHARLADRLARGIARGRLPQLAATPPTLATAASSALTGATDWLPYNGGVPLYLARYSLLGGSWGPSGPGFPLYAATTPTLVHAGNGTDAGAALNPSAGNGGGAIRFQCAAPDLEIVSFFGGATTNGYRLLVDGEYAATGELALGSGGSCYQRVTFGDGSAAFRRPRTFELLFDSGGIRFQGIRSAALYPPSPAPLADGLRLLVHGDSFVDNTGASPTTLHPNLALCTALLCGQRDVVVTGVGSTGFVANGVGPFSNFLQRVALDVIAPAPQVIVELGGCNDEALAGSGAAGAAQVQAAVAAWLAKVTAALPDTLVFMTGGMSPGQSNTGPRAAVRDAKNAAAALYPGQVVFIDNLAEPWVTGAGKVGATTGAGNSDWVTGADGTHPTPDGHVYLASRIAGAIGAAVM